MYHCDTCDACFLNCHKERHRCLKSPLKGHDCPLCLESIHYSQKRCDILNCGHIAHYDCLVSYLAHQDKSNGGPVVPNCPTCRKSLLSKEAAQPYWEALRLTIRLNPMPADWFGPVAHGDILMTQADGPIAVDEVVSSTASVLGIYLFTGLVANCAMSALSKVVEVDIMCNDCELKGRSVFHVFGLECRSCRGYNTARI
jgi:hypothetical protein